MALVSGRNSALNPNAPLFIPAALRQVEDFSPKWWELVKTSTWFRDYWLSQRKEDDFGESANDAANDDIEDILPETFDLGLEEDFLYLENEFEQLSLSSEAQEYAAYADPNDVKKPLDDLDINLFAKVLLKNLTIPKSPKGRGPKSPVGKNLEKPAQHVSTKCAPRRIHQPR